MRERETAISLVVCNALDECAIFSADATGN